MKPNFKTALDWVTAWMNIMHPELHTGDICPTIQYWSDEFTEYALIDNEMTGPYLTATSIEITEIPIFRFIVPSTKDDLFTVLNILNQ